MEHHQADTLRSQGRFTFAQVPLVMRKDPELQLADIAVTMFVLPWLDRSGVGWVAVPTISRGARLSVRSVQLSLRRLEDARWFAVMPSPGNRTGRKFAAQWMNDEGFSMLCDRLGLNDETTTHRPALVYIVTKVVGPIEPVQPVAHKEEEPRNRSSSLKTISVGDRTDDFIIERAACSPLSETTLTRGGAGEHDDDPDVRRLRRTIPDLYRSEIEPKPLEPKLLRGAVQCNARIVAKLLFDEHSYKFHCGPLWEIARGELSPSVYLEAIDITLRDLGPKDVANLGAYFKATLGNLRLRRTDEEFADEWNAQHGVA
jgi:hypothetical protein